MAWVTLLRGLLRRGVLVPCVLIMAGLSASAGSAAITQFTGGDPGEGLDLSGNYLYAVDVNGPGGQTIQGLTFTAETATSGIAFNSTNHTQGTVTYDGGTTPNDVALSNLAYRIRYATNPNTVDLDYNVTAGETYRLQLLLDCTAYNSRHQDIMVDGAMVADDLALVKPVPGAQGPGTLVSYDYTATSDTTHVVLGPSTLDGDPILPGDNNAVFNAFTVQQLPGNTVGHWRLDDGSPGTAATTVNSLFNNGALQGTANGSPVFNADTPEGTIIDGLSGPKMGPSTASLQFSNSQSVFIPFDPLLEPDQFTVEFFMKADAQSAFPGIVQKKKQLGGSSTAVGPGNITWGVGKEANELTFARVDTTTSLNRTWTIPGSTADGEWHHLALTYEEVAGNGVWTLYRDYELMAVNTSAGPIDYDGMSGLFFGDAPATDFHQYLGLLDEVRFSDIVLTPEQFLRAVPEPSSLILLAFGCLLMLAPGRRRR